MATPKKVGPRKSTSTKKAPVQKYSQQPVNTIYEPKSDAVLAVEAEIEGLPPHLLLERIAKGKPTIVVYPTERYHDDGINYDLIYVSEIYHATFAEQQKAAIEASPYIQPKLQAIATQEVKEKVINVIEVPVIEGNSDWESQAKKSQKALVEKVTKLV